MRNRSVPVQLAAIAIAVATGWVVNSQVRASGATRQQRIALLTSRSAEQKALAVYVMKGLADGDECWDGVASARSRAYTIRDRVRALDSANAGPPANIGDMLRREQVLVDHLDGFALDANIQESSVLDQFGARYNAAAVAAARQDLADAVRGVHEETRHWTRAIQLMMSARSVASGQAMAKSEFDAADVAEVRSTAALSRLADDWTVVVHLLRAESDDTQSELSKST